jgi:error-prone DNA polymerase
MSRKRSEVAIEAHHRGFVQGAMSLHGVSEEIAERVFAKVKGFSGFGFPKSHAAAFGLLAYQSTWLRVHYGAEFLCALLNEQPMGFYPPDALVHEATRRGLEVLAPDVNFSGVECGIDEKGRILIGLGYIRGASRAEIEALVSERLRRGPFASLADLVSRAGAGAPALDLLAWSGACDRLAATSLDVRTQGVLSPRRLALWQLGVATPGHRAKGGTQLALPLELPQAPALRQLSGWEAMLADYSTLGMTVSSHPVALLRGRLPADSRDSRDLIALPHGVRIKIGGLVVARQRPGTAGGVVFVLLEDEFGVINLIVPPAVYERHRLAVRTEPLLLAEGRLERHAQAGGAINVLVNRIGPIEAPGGLLAQVQDFAAVDAGVLAENAREKRAAAAGGPGERAPGVGGQAAGSEAYELDDFRAVAPPVMSFASGRRR